MIHHLYTLYRPGNPTAEKLDTTPQSAVLNYARDVYPDTTHAQLTVAVWKDGQWCGYYVATLQPGLDTAAPISAPECFEPLPCPKVAPAAPTQPRTMTPAETFKACPAEHRDVALIALQERASTLGALAEVRRDFGRHALADEGIGQQTAVLAALDVLRELHKEGGE